MNFNSCSDIPALFFMLLLFAFYGVRKQYSILYRKYSFFVVYFIQTVLTLKMFNDILLRIDFIQTFFADNADSMIVQVNQLIFGGNSSRDSDANKYQMQYFVSVFTCLFFCQAWKTAKWVEIRYKTMDMQDSSFFARFNNYFRQREVEDS